MKQEKKKLIIMILSMVFFCQHIAFVLADATEYHAAEDEWDVEGEDEKSNETEITEYEQLGQDDIEGSFSSAPVTFAVSMICGKELLVFDEPTSGLDYDSMTQVAGLIRSLASSGKIIFVVTHDYEFVCQSCSRLIHFDNGTLTDDLLLSKQNEKKIRTIFDLEV